MVEIKVDRREIVFRVFYAGTEGAVKFSTLRELHEGMASDGVTDITVLHAGRDRIVGFRHRPPGESAFGMKVAIEVLTIAGAIQAPANARLLLRVADAVVFLDDRNATPLTEDRARRALDDVRRTIGGDRRDIPLIVQCYGDSPGHRVEAFRQAGVAEDVRVATTPADLRGVLVDVERRIIDRCRAWERELASRGMTDHVKIRDRIYEKVVVGAGAVHEATGAVRLIRSLDDDPYERRGALWFAFFVAVSVALAAAVFTALVL